MRDKGQVTIFVIIAIILLISFSVIFYIMLPEDTDIGIITGDVETVDEEIEVYIRDCLTRVTDEAMDIVRLQGGYITFPNGVVTKIIDSNVSIVNGRVVDQFGKIQVPYYIVNDQISIPSLSLTESQIESFVNERLLECIDGFSPFEKEDYIVTFESPKSNVSLADIVLVELTFPIVAEKEDFQYLQDYFFIQVPINYREMHRKATRLTMDEYIGGFLEEHEKKLISLYAYAGGDKGNYDLPPLAWSEFGFDCESVSWDKDDVKDKLKTIYKENYPLLRIGRLNNTRYVADNDFSKGIYDGMIIDLLSKDMDTHLDIIYDEDWDLDFFDVQPSSGKTIEPDGYEFSGIPFLPTMCDHTYNFKYTYRHPVLFDMWDDKNDAYPRTSSSGKFKYNFFLESHLCGNRVKDCGGPNPNIEIIEQFLAEYGSTSSICENNNNSGFITFDVSDENNQSLDEVFVRYYCGDVVHDCEIGLTDSDGQLKIKLPYCQNGIALFSKREYHDSQRVVSVTNDIGMQYSITLMKKKDFNYSVNLIKAEDYARAFYLTNAFTKPACDGTTPEQFLADLYKKPPNKFDQVIINLVNEKSPSTNSLIYSELGSLPSVLQIGPGGYSLDSTYMGFAKIDSVTKGGRELSINENGTGSYFGPFPLGQTTMEFDFNMDELINTNHIEFILLIDHLSDEELDFDIIGEELINEDGEIDINIKIPENSDLTENCANIEKIENVIVPTEFYERHLTPRLSRK